VAVKVVRSTGMQQFKRRSGIWCLWKLQCVQ
jgi:hypothetical protein